MPAKRTVRATSAVRRQSAELAFGLIFEVFVLAVRAVRAARAMAGQTTVSALAGRAAHYALQEQCEIAGNRFQPGTEAVIIIHQMHGAAVLLAKSHRIRVRDDIVAPAVNQLDAVGCAVQFSSGWISG